jgi:tetratricopeptide (TPR) repeat protein
MRRLGLWLLLCTATIAANAEDLDPLYEGRDLLDTPDRDRGVALLEKVIAEGAASPKAAEKQQRAGRAHMYLHQGAEAVAAMERALALEPKDVRYAFWVGAAWLDVDAHKSLAAFERAIALDPKHEDSWFGLGRARYEKDDLEGALEAFRKVVELDPSYTDAHAYTAGALEKLMRDDEAIAAHRRVLALEPSRTFAGTRIGWLQYEAGRYEDSLATWTSFTPRAPDDLELHAHVVQALFALGRYADAAPWREKVRSIHAATKDPTTRAYKGFCIDRFTVDGLRVRAFEEYDRSEDALYHYVFEVGKDGKVVRRINLEPTPPAPGLGIPGGQFRLGSNVGREHFTYERKWTSEPPYPELKAAVIDAIRGKIQVVSSSSRGPKGGSKDK